jgi:predicted O-methyltransferase YrrM
MSLTWLKACLHGIRRSGKLRSQREGLDAIPKINFNTINLKPESKLVLPEILNSRAIETDWTRTHEKLKPLSIPDGTGGVNPGDRRAIYYLIRALRPHSVLEVGTHIGASTVHIASAMLDQENGASNSLTSVDVAKVNDPAERRWEKFGARYSPSELISTTGAASFVQFVQSPSLEFLKNSKLSFDFIFLDGDHSAATVYREVSMALERLNKDGVILLHDFFPDNRPMWANGAVIHGPFLAVERMRNEGARLKALPLGALPWPTKLGSFNTSLALLGAK